MEFRNHFFISYCHRDNTSGEDEVGWVTRFHKRLALYTRIELGEEAEIWRDDRELQGNHALTPEILEQLPKTAALVTIVSPSYVKSKWCADEREEFCREAERTGGLLCGNQARIFKVVKTPVPDEEQLPELMRDMLGYEFFVYENGRRVDFDPGFGSEYAERLNKQIAWLAQEAVPLLRSLEAGACELEEEPDEGKPVVFLAETSYDVESKRLDLERRLRRYGYRVLPEGSLPVDEEDCAAQVYRDLERSQLSIHMVGREFVPVLNGPGRKSSTQLQNELAAVRSRDAGLQRLIWLPESMQAGDDEQANLLAAIRTDAEAQRGADLVSCGLPDLEQAALAQLKAIEEAAARAVDSVESPSERKLLYMLCDERDRADLKPLRKFLYERGVDVELPLFEGPAEQIRGEHESLLSRCDAALLFWGAGDEAWRRASHSGLLKMRAYREGRPEAEIFTYLAAPDSVDKEARDFEHNMLDGRAGFREEQLSPLLEALGGSRS